MREWEKGEYLSKFSIEKLVSSDILRIRPYIPGKPVEEVKRELGLKKVIKLASNENSLGPSPKAVEAIKNYAFRIHLYPDGAGYYLRKSLAKKFKLDKENIILGNGSDEIVSLLTRFFIQKGDQVIMGDPSFLMYKIDTQLSGGKVIPIPLKNFKLNISEMLRSITPQTKIIFIANPNNPTGTIVRKKEVEDLFKFLPSSILIIFDEAYCEYVEDPDYPQTLEWVRKGKNLIILRTFSKIYGLAGLRIGYGIAKKEIIDILNRARPPFNVNSLAQIAALASLSDIEHLHRSKKLVKEGKKFLYHSLKEMEIPFVPTQTNFILIRTGEKTKEIVDELLKRGIIVRGMESYNLPQYIRLTIGTQEENETFIRELKSILFSS
ncbi:histidinol-phosphate transaminase [Candidatus Aerophobetes bacterium]|nr:histidinol-phosphate transaminase [Candidatus Aerophobetes bacterium]